jgi:GNAT superfamily N-acetyltransferase
MPNYSIHPILCTEELERLSHLAKVSFKDSFAHLTTEENMKKYLDTAFCLSQLKQELNDPRAFFFVAKNPKGQFAGYAKLLKGKDGYDCIQSENPVQLVRLYVDPTLKGQGVGALIMEHVIEWAEDYGHDSLFLGVHHQNGTAIRFYENWGFEAVGTRTFLLGEEVQQDNLMCLPLKALALPDESN